MLAAATQNANEMAAEVFEVTFEHAQIFNAAKALHARIVELFDNRLTHREFLDLTKGCNLGDRTIRFKN